MPMILAGLACGFIFGWGLLVSQMTDPLKILNPDKVVLIA